MATDSESAALSSMLSALAENWLDRALIACPACGAALYRVGHSPLDDEHYLYCDSCPARAVVSTGDPRYRSLAAHPAIAGAADVYSTLMGALEGLVRRCSCGGRYLHDAPRRCHACHAVVVGDAPAGIDLWPALYALEDDDEREPDSAEVALAAEFEARHVLRGNIWL